MAKKPKLSDAEFIELWNSADDLEVMAGQAGTSKTSAASRASSLRKTGESLRYFKGSGAKDIGDERFVDAWKSRKSVIGVAEELGLPKNTVDSRIRKLRDAGKIPPKRQTSQAALLREILEALKRIEEKL